MTKINITIWTYVELAVSLWAACVLYIIPLKHRPNFRMRLGLATAGTCAVAVAAVWWKTAFPAVTVPAVVSMSGVFLLSCLFISRRGGVLRGVGDHQPADCP